MKFFQKKGFNLPEGRDGFKRQILMKINYFSHSFNLPEGRDGFKRWLETSTIITLFVSIYPKAEMGLRAARS